MVYIPDIIGGLQQLIEQLQTQGTNLYNLLMQILSVIMSLPGLLSFTVNDFMTVFYYPFEAIQTNIVDLLQFMENNTTGFVWNLQYVINYQIAATMAITELLVDASTFIVMGTIIAMVVVLRIYFFVKDISFAGFKI